MNIYKNNKNNYKNHNIKLIKNIIATAASLLLLSNIGIFAGINLVGINLAHAEENIKNPENIENPENISTIKIDVTASKAENLNLNNNLNNVNNNNLNLSKQKAGIEKFTAQTAQKSIKNLNNINAAEQNSPQTILLKDASITANYAPVGYYENFAVRGLALDLDHGYLQNDMPISARSMPSFENIETIEIDKGFNNAEQTQNHTASIQYRTKRPANVAQLNTGFETSKEGNLQVSNHVDFGKKFKDWGYRTNLSYTRLDPYVKNSKGERYTASLALDAKINPLFKIQSDLQINKQNQATVPGYMLFLDNNDMPNTLPDINAAYINPYRNLNQANWRQPMKTTHIGGGLKTQYQFHPNISWQQALSFQDTRTDDFVAFPYPFYENKNYILREYNSQNERRKGYYVDQALQINLNNNDNNDNNDNNSSNIEHQLRLGGNFYQYSSHENQKLDYKRELHNLEDDATLQVYAKIKSKPAADLTQKQSTFYINDAISKTTEQGKYTLKLGAKFSQIDEKYSSTDGVGGTAFMQKQKKQNWLPQLALNYQNPSENFGTYISHQQAVMLGQLPETIDDRQFLPARVLKQNEIGLYYLPRPDLKIQAAVFDLRRPYEYLDDNWVYQQNGKEIRQGLELGVSGSLTKNLNIDASAAYIWRATQKNVSNKTLSTDLSGKQASNIPKFKSSVAVDYDLKDVHANLNGLRAYAALNIESARFVDAANSFKTKAYSTTDLGFKYTFEKRLLAACKPCMNPNNRENFANSANPADSIKIGVNNLFNKKYWKDVSTNYGEPYLHLGAPRTFYLQMNIGF